MDVIIPFHFSNHCSIKLLNGSSTLEFSASSLARVVNPYKAFVMVPSGVVLMGMKVQHWPPIITQTPPFSANFLFTAILFLPCHLACGI
jgi:hypothetical protein